MVTAVSFSLRPALPVQSTSALLRPIAVSGVWCFAFWFFPPLSDLTIHLRRISNLAPQLVFVAHMLARLVTARGGERERKPGLPWQLTRCRAEAGRRADRGPGNQVLRKFLGLEVGD